MANTSVNQAEAEAFRKNEAKWSKPLWAAGWNGIPSIIIEKQEALGLDALDMNIIVHLSNYWWHADNLPCPSVENHCQGNWYHPANCAETDSGTTQSAPGYAH